MPLLETLVIIRVIARGGKFLGDDIGGAEVTIRDVRSGELLAKGRTTGGSGPPTVMTAALTRTQPIPVAAPGNDACKFEAALPLTEPRLVEIAAYGPLAAPESANWTRSTTWLYPGCSISPDGSSRIDGFLLEIQGLVVQALNPPAHFMPSTFNLGTPIPIRANVTMMCGCPIAKAPWPVDDFEIVAEVSGDGVQSYPLEFDQNAPGGAPSQFFTTKWAPAKRNIYTIAIRAFQKSTGNTGVGFTTVNLVSST